MTEGSESAFDETLTERSGTGEQPELRSEPGRATLIGRYVVLTRLGAGAMGVVWAAYDPELDRKLAIKLLRHGNSDASRARLQREARALAKLDHPNVVAVHDVGIHDDQLFVAMDYVAGQTLGRWLAAGPHPWREIVARFVAAGRGLAAAHEAGLVHRDFKPDNVMIGDDGRARVMDFGLARVGFDTDDSGVSPRDEPERVGVDKLTRTGALMGTPAYMALEQFEGGPVDARSDQFGFCVALFEALYRERPFVADSLPGLISALEREAIREPRSAEVPGWLRKLVVRGLASDPARRWPSMRALLDALDAGITTRPRRRWLVVALLGTLVAGAVVLARTPSEPPRACSGLDAKLSGVWDEARRVEVETAILATGLGYAPDTARRVEQHLDGYASAWVAARVDACEATARGEQSSELLDLRMACLDERFASLSATIDELGHADARTVERAVQAVLELPRLDRCSDGAALLAAIPPPEDPELATRVDRLDARLVVAASKQSLGHYDEALALVDEIVREAEAIDHEPLHARAWLRQGVLQELVGDYAAAESTLERAYQAALAQRMPDEAARASALLMFVTGTRLARGEDGHRWATHAEPLSRASRSDELRARYFYGVAVLSRSDGQLDEARRYHEQGLALRERALGPDHLDVAASLNGLGNVLQNLGRLDEAQAYFARALSIREARLGPAHPNVAITLNGMAALAAASGRLDDARRYAERSLAILEAALGPDHPDVALPLSNLGGITFEQGEYAKARVYHERALAIYEAAHGREHPDLAQPLDSLGHLAFVEGDLELARRHQLRSLAVLEAAWGPDHPDLAYPLSSLARTESAAANHELARDFHARALRIREAALGPDHGDLVGNLVGLGLAALDLQAPADAIAPLERALVLLTAQPSDPLDLAEARLTLARACFDAPPDRGRDRPRARELAELARGDASSGGEQGREMLAAIDGWLVDHPI